MQENVKCLIIGAGPAGYTAAIYTSRADLNPLVIEGMQPGGQLTITNEVENFPGYPEGSSGPVIMDDIRQQALHVGARLRPGMVTEVDFSSRPFHCKLDDGTEVVAETVIVATGANARWIGMPGEAQYRGFGVSTCATCDGNFFRNKTTVVIGGGDTALEDALYLANLCNKVYIVHRRDQFRGTMALQKQVLATPNIDVVWDTVPVDIVGVKQGFIKKVTGLQVKNVKSGEERTLEVDGVFEAIGVTPVSDLFKGQLEMNEQGYILTQPGTCRTNVEGVFAAGDAMRGPATVVEGIADAARFAEIVVGKPWTYEIPVVAIPSITDASARKGILAMAGPDRQEGSRCLHCDVVCENCVDVCPNRANVPIQLPDGSMQILHVDRMCNECGNCTAFCPYASEPCKDKLTLFETEEQFAASDNYGFLFLPDGQVRTRLLGGESVYDPEIGGLPQNVRDMILMVKYRYDYLYKDPAL